MSGQKKFIDFGDHWWKGFVCHKCARERGGILEKDDCGFVYTIAADTTCLFCGCVQEYPGMTHSNGFHWSSGIPAEIRKIAKAGRRKRKERRKRKVVEDGVYRQQTVKRGDFISMNADGTIRVHK